MKLKVVTYTNQPEHPGLAKLKASMDLHKIDYHIIVAEWKGYGTKIIELYNYLKTLEGYTHFLFTDAHDTYFLHGNIQMIEGILISGEKNCWPDPHLSTEISTIAPSPQFRAASRWIYPNSGGITGNIHYFLDLFDENKPSHADDDQRWWTSRFLNEPIIDIDYHCEIFQSIAFESPDEFEIINGRFKNIITNTYPALIHGNGRTDMTKIYNL
jgi:hypothetical protein